MTCQLALHQKHTQGQFLITIVRQEQTNFKVPDDRKGSSGLDVNTQGDNGKRPLLYGALPFFV
jgi:hypothetical protein